ncbi:uncharacterized protein [Gossypium hirsutum]|uniref:Uncharacterized protein isoform X1 n=1 Tax=Gossypium hirsutum TaxID=3635 RepID=A0A1U8NKT1_GOSHI|nr:uncharacterized protein LOC107949531 isoform X1 [Gossypium hirsutum]
MLHLPFSPKFKLFLSKFKLPIRRKARFFNKKVLEQCRSSILIPVGAFDPLLYATITFRFLGLNLVGHSTMQCSTLMRLMLDEPSILFYLSVLKVGFGTWVLTFEFFYEVTIHR